MAKPVKHRVRRYKSSKRSTKSGLLPGAPVFVGEKKTEEVKITLIDYDEINVEIKEVHKVEDCFPFKERPTVTWINVDGLHDVSIAEKLGEHYNIHSLVIEDLLNTEQRPKMDIIDDYIFIVLKMLTYNEETKYVDVEQVSLIIGNNYVITFQENIGDIFDSIRDRIKLNKGRTRKAGADYLAYSLIDAVVDNYFKVIENIGEDIELIEEELVTNPRPETLQKIHLLKREMIFLRKSVWPLREMIGNLEREETPLIKESTSIYLRDLYDHTIQVIDSVETYRDMISGMLDVYLSSISNRMNEVMKVLTIFAAIFIPLTFIAGLYGMNFNTANSPLNMPELNWYYGYPFALGLMATVAITMLFFFKRKKWF
ncbi:MAG: magnesium/cobalt transporter CorA [Thermodesulfovibrionia bacterium]|nr:magnesium/cobalt transporter CorA [Thermodesulfovibrionia bacterium]